MSLIDGILLLDKSIEMTSNAALQKAKRLFGIKKAGHTGSLDPLATGMLPICFGEATKFSQFLLESDKYYRVTAQLGIKTATGDAEGEIIASRPVENVTASRLEILFQQFTGEIEQIPPMFSAIKQNGRPLYELARKGITVERKSRTVQIYRLQLIGFQDDHVEMEVHCSKGTYIRTLVEDIGESLGCGAFVSQLRRLAVAPYSNQKMYSLDDLSKIQENDSAGLVSLLLPIDTALQKLPIVKLISASAFYFRTGQAVTVQNAPREGLVRVLDENEKFMGIGEILEDGRVTPKRLVAS